MLAVMVGRCPELVVSGWPIGKRFGGFVQVCHLPKIELCSPRSGSTADAC